MALARLRGKAVARLSQLSAEYDPQPPFGRVEPDLADDELARTLRNADSASAADPGGGIDYDRIPRFPRALRGAIGLLAPTIAAKPKRLARAGA